MTTPLWPLGIRLTDARGMFLANWSGLRTMTRKTTFLVCEARLNGLPQKLKIASLHSRGMHCASGFNSGIRGWPQNMSQKCEPRCPPRFVSLSRNADEHD
jgi:hypothetical protein